MTQSKTLKEESKENKSQQTIITTIIVIQFIFVYTVCACLKAMTQSKTLKEQSSNKNHKNDNYNYYCDTIYFQLE